MTCADISNEGYIYNPPSEDKGLMLRVAVGCSHNACTFCGMYRNVKFRVRPLDQLLPLIAEAKERTPNLRRVFLGDGNALTAPTDELLPILQRLKSTFPTLNSISCHRPGQHVGAAASARRHDDLNLLGRELRRFRHLFRRLRAAAAADDYQHQRYHENHCHHCPRFLHIQSSPFF